MFKLFCCVLGLDILKKLTQSIKNKAIEFVLLQAVYDQKQIIGFKSTDWFNSNIINEYPETFPDMEGTFHALSILNVSGYEFMKEDKFKGIPGYIAKMQREDGAFKSQEWDSEYGPHICYYAVASHALLACSVQFKPDLMRKYINTLTNFEGGFSADQGGEARADMTYFSVASLMMLGFKYDVLDLYLLKPWLLKRITSDGVTPKIDEVVDCTNLFYVVATLDICCYRKMTLETADVHLIVLNCLEGKKKCSSTRLEHVLFCLSALGIVGSKGLKNVNPYLFQEFK